jgi:hypothetical protein
VILFNKLKKKNLKIIMTKRGLTRKELEELKKREETEAAASVYMCLQFLLSPVLVNSFFFFEGF